MRSARGSLTDAAGSLTDAVLSPLRRSRRESAGPDEAAVSLRQSEDNALLSYLEQHRGACLQSGWVELENPAAGRLDRKYKRRWFEIHPHALVWYKLHAPELPKGYLLLSSTHALDETSGRGAAISVTGTAGVLVRFRASSPEEHFLWIETLTTALRARAAAAAAAEDSLAEQSRLEKWPSLMEPSPAQPRSSLSDVPSELYAERREEGTSQWYDDDESDDDGDEEDDDAVGPLPPPSPPRPSVCESVANSSRFLRVTSTLR